MTITLIEMWASLFIILGLSSLYILYHHFARELQEVDPILLNHQTSISETRKSSESAVYRSVDVPHGVTVTRGLSLRNGYKIRDGCLKDVWYLALNNHQTKIAFGDKSFTLGQVNSILHLIAQKLEQKNVQKVVVLGRLNESPELALVIMTCFFITDITVVLCNSFNDVNAIHNTPNEILVTNSSFIDKIPQKMFSEVIGINVNGGLSSNTSSTHFTQILDIGQDIESSTDFLYNPDTDFAKVNNHPYSFVSKGTETRFFQVNFVSAVAAKVMSIPSPLSWNEKDSLLLSYTTQSFSSTNILFGLCCGLISNIGSIQIIDPKNIGTLKDLSTYKPTVLCIDSHILKTLCSSTKKSFWQSFKLQRSEYLNSLGYFNSFGKIEKSLHLKMVYACQLSPVLSSFICNFCKSILGCRIVREVYTNYSIGPILKTNIYDFRIVQNRNLALLGVPANSVELKTVNPAEGESRGKLQVRGMSIGKGDHLVPDDEYWVDAGLEGSFARDGCFYSDFQ